MWYMDCLIGKAPRGFSNEPADGYIAVSDELRKLHEDNPTWIFNGVTLVPTVESQEVYEPTYRELRAMAFPPIGEQLDMIYWDKVNGTNNWVEFVQTVKQRYPKPV